MCLFWWDNTLNELKFAAMASHKLWLEAGRPRSGDIFKRRTHDKFCYKALIKDRQKQAKVSSSNELNDLLLTIESSSFWKTWKRKVWATRNTLPCNDGSNDEILNTETF